MACDYSKLKGKIKEYFGTQNEFAKALGIGRVALSKRLTGKNDFTQSEIMKAAELLGIEKDNYAEYFFKFKV